MRPARSSRKRTARRSTPFSFANLPLDSWPKKNSCPGKNMTDSFMPCCRKLFSSGSSRCCCSPRRAGRRPTSASATRFSRRRRRLYPVSADFNINLNARLEDAIERGITLYFVVDFELSRSRWYWLDEQVASRSQTYQLSYHALTRQYRLSSGALHQSFTSLERCAAHSLAPAQLAGSRQGSWPAQSRSTSPPCACAST
jgi:hypothetical protein